MVNSMSRISHFLFFQGLRKHRHKTGTRSIEWCKSNGHRLGQWLGVASSHQEGKWFQSETIYKFFPYVRGQHVHFINMGKSSRPYLQHIFTVVLMPILPTQGTLALHIDHCDLDHIQWGSAYYSGRMWSYIVGERAEQRVRNASDHCCGRGGLRQCGRLLHALSHRLLPHATSRATCFLVLATCRRSLAIPP